MPIEGAQPHAQAHLVQIKASPHLVGGPSQGHEAAQQVQSVHAGEKIKEGVAWVGRQEVACGVQLSPRKELPKQERYGEQAAYNQAVSDAFYPSPACRNLCVLQCDTAQDQRAGIET